MVSALASSFGGVEPVPAETAGEASCDHVYDDGRLAPVGCRRVVSEERLASVRPLGYAVGPDPNDDDGNDQAYRHEPRDPHRPTPEPLSELMLKHYANGGPLICRN